MEVFTVVGLFFLPLIMAAPAIIMYYVIKFAIKNAIKESKDEGIL